MKRATTDSGTVVLHGLLIAAFGAAALTGLRIASDDPGLRWLAIFDAVLPMESVWLIHLLAAVLLIAVLTAYGTYMWRSRLLPRISFGPAQLNQILRPGRMRWIAAGRLVYWIFMPALAVETVSGIAQMLGSGGDALSLHIWAAWVCLAFPVAHVALHACYGGSSQLLRVLRPARLIVPPPPPDFAALLADHLDGASPRAGDSSPRQDDARAADDRVRRPMVWALAGAIAATVGLFELESMTRQHLVMVRIDPSQAPKLDGDLADPAWARARSISVLTEHGANFGGTGESLVEIRAVQDGTTAYMAFTWTDPTRSLKHLPLVKRNDGWHLIHTAHDQADEQAYFEDKFSVLIARPVLPLIGAAIHLSARPLAGKPGSLTGRGLHFTAAGKAADVWQWHADHADIIDDGYFSTPKEPTPEQADGSARYAGGFTAERGTQRYMDNFATAPVQTLSQELLPRRLPRDVASTAGEFGRIRNDPNVSEDEDARWWMSPGESIPYSPAADAAIPLGTVIPGVIVLKPRSSGAGPVGTARWAAGRWTLTLSRKLKPAQGAGVPMETGSMLWVAAFDHSETRHSRHLRPIILEVENGETAQDPQ